MYKLVLSKKMDAALLKSSISDTFKKREMDIRIKIDFDATVMKQLQGYWASFVRKMKLADAPGELEAVITVINNELRNIYGSK